MKLGNRLAPIAAFARKEILEVLRQPRLVLSLILGPFLILGLFGLGYRSNPPPLEAILVLPAGSELAERVGDFQETLQPAVEVVEITSDEADARRRLLQREVDVVVVAPPDAVDTIRNNRQATIYVLHDRLDPFDRAYITIFSRASIDELNRAVLEEIAAAGQQRVADLDDAIPQARASAGRMSASLEAGDVAAARQAQLETRHALRIAEQGFGVTTDFVEGIDRELGGGDPATYGQEIAETGDAVEEIDVEDPTAAESAASLESRLADLEQELSTFTSLEPAVLVQPFVAEAEAIVGPDLPLTTFYGPGVVVVLLQHIALTFAALSIVRERSLGITELFRVGPLGKTELLVGKYLGYATLGASIGAVLITAVVFVFATPQLGSWWWVALVLSLLLLASLGLGFTIASAANSDSQAIQLSMLTLLFTIFFSGFVLSLSRIGGWVQPVAFAVPATAGIGALQDVMFRGESPRAVLVGVLAGYAVLTFIAARWGLGKRLAV